MSEMNEIKKEVRINPDQFASFACPNCIKEYNITDSTLFEAIIEIKKVPTLLSPNGQPSIIVRQIEVSCLNCNCQYDLQTVIDSIKDESVSSIIFN